ncbi:MAG TPA: YitT family protein [Negativicutes bacterium]
MRKVLNVIFSCLIVCIGVVVLRHSHLVTGGTTGMALGMSYLFNMPFSVALMTVSIPFYILSILRMGLQFTLSTFFAVLTLSFMSGIDQWLPDFIIPEYVGAVLGGGLMGLGLSLLFLNGSSLGGVNVLVLYLQKKFGWDPGKLTFVADFMIVVFGTYSVGLVKGIYSVLSVLILSLIISYFKGRIAAANISSNVRQ